MMEIGKKIKLPDMENWLIKMEINILDNLKISSMMDMDKLYIVINLFFKENSETV